MKIEDVIKTGEPLDAEQLARVTGGTQSLNINFNNCACGDKDEDDNDNGTSVSSCGMQPVNQRTCGEQVGPPVSPEPLEPEEP